MLYIIGDSHTQALRDGFKKFSDAEKMRLRKRFGDVTVNWLVGAAKYRRKFFDAQVDRVILKKDSGRRMKELFGARPHFEKDDDRLFAFSMGFHLPYYNFRMWKEFTLDPSISDKHFLSSAVFRKFIIAQNREVLLFYKKLRKLNVKFVVLGSPPPSRNLLAHSDLPGVSEREFILIFEAVRSVFARELRRFRVHYVLPPDAIARDGFLPENLARTTTLVDPHGNADYGELFLRHAFRVMDLHHFKPQLRKRALFPRIAQSLARRTRNLLRRFAVGRTTGDSGPRAGVH
jgi:hypothetical protein